MKLLEMKANKKLIQKQLTEETGKEDLTNISTSIKEGKSGNDLDSSIGLLQDKIWYVYINIRIVKSIVQLQTTILRCCISAIPCIHVYH